MVIQLIYFGAGLAYLIALGQLLRRWKSRNLLLSGLFLATGTWSLFLGLWLAGLVRTFPFVILPFILGACFFGPLYYLYLRTVIEDREDVPAPRFLLFLPAFLLLLALWVTAGIGYWSPFRLNASSRLESFRFIILILLSHDIFYLIFFNHFISFAWRAAFRGNRKISIILLLNGILILAGLTLFAWAMTDLEFLGAQGGLLMTLVYVFLFLAGQHEPELLSSLVEERKLRYEKSKIVNLDETEVSDKLNVLMGTDKLFKKDDLTLAELADLMKLSTHQLSEFINTEHKLNFNRFVNGFRIKEAGELLLTDKKRSILSIAYEVGFNSSSAFHTAFRREMDVSPGEWRKRGKKLL